MIHSQNQINSIILSQFTLDDVEERAFRGAIRALEQQQKLPEKKTSEVNEEDYFTREEFLQKYKMCETTLYLRMRDKSIPYVKIGRRVYIPKKQFNEGLKKFGDRYE